MRSILRASAAVAALFALGAGSAWATPDASGSTTLVEPNFGAYTAIKTYEVYSPTNPTNPLPLAGNYTYIYTITNSPSSFTCLVGFDMETPVGSITAAGYIPGAGVAPSAVTVGTVSIEWDWITPTLCPGFTSEQLYVHSTYGPGTVVDTVISVSDEFALDTPGTCVGPFVPPEVVGEPLRLHDRLLEEPRGRQAGDAPVVPERRLRRGGERRRGALVGDLQQRVRSALLPPEQGPALDPGSRQAADGGHAAQPGGG